MQVHWIDACSLARGMLVSPVEMTTNANVSRRKTVVVPTGNARMSRELHRYFEYSHSGVEVLQDGLQVIAFGEFLVDQGVLDRYQLFRALQMQDRLPGVRLGEAAAALGYAPINAIERLFERYTKMPVANV